MITRRLIRSFFFIFATLLPLATTAAEKTNRETASELREAQLTLGQVAKLRGEREALAARIAAIRPLVAGQKDAALRAKNERL